MIDDPEVPPGTVAALLEDRDAQLVDVREGYEYAGGHLPGALHLPLAELSDAAGALDRERPVILYCRGGERSAMAAEALRASGWEAASMSGGLVAWAEQNLPLEPPDGRVVERSMLPAR